MKIKLENILALVGIVFLVVCIWAIITPGIQKVGAFYL